MLASIVGPIGKGLTHVFLARSSFLEHDQQGFTSKVAFST